MNRRLFLQGLMAAVAVPLRHVPLIGRLIPPAGPSSMAIELAAITRKAFLPKVYAQLYKPSPLLNALLKKEEEA